MAGPQAIPELDRKGYREFGIVTGAIVAGLFGLFFPWVFDRAFPAEFPWWPWAVFGVLAFWGLIAPMSLKPVYNVWMKFGLFMGTYIMTPLIMSIVFYGMFMPFGLVMRLFGKDGMARKLDAAADSYRIISEQPKTKNLEKPF
ncbi:MAG: SxtJ family membrane protein [Gammaproteobacteria bacterium]